jgi:hypothetical protein
MGELTGGGDSGDPTLGTLSVAQMASMASNKHLRVYAMD